jgi:hypothetical protein
MNGLARTRGSLAKVFRDALFALLCAILHSGSLSNGVVNWSADVGREVGFDPPFAFTAATTGLRQGVRILRR